MSLRRHLARLAFLAAILACRPALGAPGPGKLPAPPDTLAARLVACTSCHGEQGRATSDGYYPRIAGKPAGYLFNQLSHFRDGRRSADSMAWMVDGMPDAYLRDMARHFAEQHPPYPPPQLPTVSAQVLSRGRQLALAGDPQRRLPACAACHGDALLGVQPAVPGLLGLPRDYLNAQFGAWRNGTRRAHAPDCMAEITRRLSGDDIAAVTAWLAAQPVPSPAQAAPASNKPLPLDCGVSGSAPGRVSSPVPTGASTGASVGAMAGSGAAGPAQASSAITLPAVTPDPASSDPVARGAYLALAGNCAGCHTARGGAPYAGGRSLGTPFGSVFVPNLTPHVATGIGAWTADDFWRAMHEGRSRNGRALNPAFPYASYTLLTRADSDALFAWLRRLTPVEQARQPDALRFPWNLPFLVEAWRVLFFKPASFQPDPGRDATWNRGAYLVRGLGHCGACHTPRNALGAPTGTPLSGAPMDWLGWHAPSLTRSDAGGVGAWPIDDIAQWLGSGASVRAVATGPMARIISDSLQHLVPGDRRAMALYLQSVDRTGTSVRAPASGAAVKGVNRANVDPAYLSQGRRLYEQHCADCHGDQGEGAPPHYPALAGNRALTQDSPVNAIRTVLHGGFAPVTREHPRPYGMPPFGPQLSDPQVGALMSYLRTAWGHAASPVEARQINPLRPVPLD